MWEKVPGNPERVWKWDMGGRKALFLICIKISVITVDTWAQPH